MLILPRPAVSPCENPNQPRTFSLSSRNQILLASIRPCRLPHTRNSLPLSIIRGTLCLCQSYEETSFLRRRLFLDSPRRPHDSQSLRDAFNLRIWPTILVSIRLGHHLTWPSSLVGLSGLDWRGRKTHFEEQKGKAFIVLLGCSVPALAKDLFSKQGRWAAGSQIKQFLVSRNVTKESGCQHDSFPDIVVLGQANSRFLVDQRC